MGQEAVSWHLLCHQHQAPVLFWEPAERLPRAGAGEGGAPPARGLCVSLKGLSTTSPPPSHPGSGWGLPSKVLSRRMPAIRSQRPQLRREGLGVEGVLAPAPSTRTRLSMWAGVPRRLGPTLLLPLRFGVWGVPVCNIPAPCGGEGLPPPPTLCAERVEIPAGPWALGQSQFQGPLPQPLSSRLSPAGKGTISQL